jgi:hypothetical protein
MRTVASLFVVPATVAATLAACGGAPPAPVPPPPPPPPVATAAPTPTVEPTPSAAPVASAEPAPPPPAACPANMMLVEGEYCTEVEQTCIEEWWGKANKKRVCEKFDPAATRCIGQRVKKRYCVDKYEWPNQEGERPEVMNRFHQAQVKCAAMGKRMCTESEWNFACEGPQMKPFPYGYDRDPLTCNGDHYYDSPDMKLVAKRDPTELARLWKGVRSGSQPGCKSDFGVFDMPGNADEVAASEAVNGRFPKYDSITTGGPWYSGVRNQCRPKVYTHDEGFYYYYLSFRCCAEPDGKPTDPRTPRQISEGWSMEKVEGLAGFTTAAMKEKLRLKAEGKCTCGEKDILCKTMCGTLLGPGAKDATKDMPRARYDGKVKRGRMVTK